jgi:hypothetical protein
LFCDRGALPDLVKVEPGDDFRNLVKPRSSLNTAALLAFGIADLTL